jgi:Arc/MetJ family transcription regulator
MSNQVNAMTQTVEIEDELVAAAVAATGKATASEAIKALLLPLLQKQTARRPIDDMLDLVGKVRLRDDYDYKRARSDPYDLD